MQLFKLESITSMHFSSLDLTFKPLEAPTQTVHANSKQNGPRKGQTQNLPVVRQQY